MKSIKSIDLVSLIEREGVDLKKSGSRHIGKCRFHSDNSPSLVVYPDGWWCFSCQIGGDAVDFIRQLYGYDFNQACKYLGINAGPLTDENRRQIAEQKLQRQQRKIRQQRERDLSFTLETMIRWTRAAIASFTSDTFAEYGQIIDDLPYWEYAHDTLIYGTSDEKHGCIKAFQDFPLIERNRIFNADFDFSEWLRKFNKKETGDNERIKNYFR